MGEEKFGAVMGILVKQIVHLIIENYSYDEMTASNEFYNSKVYALLEQEETKLWHFSPFTLFNLFDEDMKLCIRLVRTTSLRILICILKPASL